MSETESTQSELQPGPSARVRIGIGAAVVLVVAALVCSVLVTALSPVGATTLLAPAAGGSSPGSVAAAAPDARGGPTDTAGASSGAPVGSPSGSGSPADPGAGPAPGAAAATAAAVLVHVLGAVRAPGVYRLAEGSRVFDALGLAGGFADGADQSSVNLARPLTDGEQLRVLALGEAPAVAVAAGPPAAGSGAGSGAATPAGAKVNLNAATALDLDALPRIGPAMAARIVGWRETNGPFSSVDDLLQVTGIGDKTLEGLRDLVTV
ncbi:ComEA family DNA-binding protein [Herbiconiux sp. 11R-BC]|uniref:helix-hairpin-helix domain-containing protein n=1 Tax=Herbiconiux sp. 11R-BC TaxID=3111637 RepID=UPI003C101032